MSLRRNYMETVRVRIASVDLSIGVIVTPRFSPNSSLGS